MDNSCFVKLLFVLALAFAFTCAASGQEDSLAYLRPSGSELRIEAAGYGITLGNKDAAVQKPASRKSGSPARVSTSFGIASLDIGFNILDNPACYGPWAGIDDFLDLSTGKSVRIGWDLAAVRVALDRRARLLFSTGIRLAFDNYAFSRPYTLTMDDNGSLMPLKLEQLVKKSKFTATYAGIPVKLSVRLAENVCLSGYVTGEILLKSYSKYKKPKVKEELSGFSLWKVTAGGSLTFYKVGIFCDCGIIPLFEGGTGSDVRTVTVGIRLGM